MSVSLLRMDNGDIGLFYVIKYERYNACLHIRRSSDEGATWGEAVSCTNASGYYVTNNDRIIRLSSGRILLPVARHNILKDKDPENIKLDIRGIASFYYSDDDGYTWEYAKNCIALNSYNTKNGLQEPGVIELNNGLIWAWARTDLGRQYEMFSRDMGETWMGPEPSIFTGPCSPLSMKRIPDNGNLLAIWNPIPNYQTRFLDSTHKTRTPLIGAISKDEGITWDNFFTLDNDEDAGYCYTAIHFVKDAILLAYCAGNAKKGETQLSKLRIKRVLLQDIYHR
jgi:sialidase-1